MLSRSLVMSVALFAVACGSRTGLVAGELGSAEAGVDGNSVDANADAVADASRDASPDTREDVALPDAEPDVVTECQDGLVTLAYGRLDEEPTGHIAMDDTNLYWTTSGTTTGSVLSMSKCGGAVTTLASNQPVPLGLVVDATSVYWEVMGQHFSRLMRVAKAGGTPVTLGTDIGGPGVLDSMNLYFAGGVGSVARVPLGGGAVTTLGQDPTTEDSGFLAVDATNVYWTTTAEVSSNRPGCVLAVPLGGGAATTLASRVDSAYGIALDATSAYWVEGPEPSAGEEHVTQNLMRVPLAGGTPVTLATAESEPAESRALALDATTAYWTTFLEGAPILSVPLGGGTPTTLATTEGYTWGVVVDSTSVYWAEAKMKNGELGSIRRLTPK